MSKARNMARMGQDTSAGYTGAFDMPAGTTAERPASAGLGWTRLNTDTGSVEVYDGSQWNAVTRPFISSVTGNIYAGATSNLVIAGQNFTGTITVRFLEGGSTVADVTGVTVTSGSATVAVPAAVYGQTAGDSIEVKIINSDGTLSGNSIVKTVLALPTGGTITTSGGYRIHTFTSSSNFVVPSGFGATADYLVVAGGGGGASQHAGGGGAGGLRSGSLSISANTYAITVGAGGAGGYPISGSGTDGLSGSNSVFSTITSTGGGGAGGFTGSTQSASPNGKTGGSGGGGGSDSGSGGAGTSGQGFAGGNGQPHNTGGSGGAGGGANAVGGNASSNTANAGDGGAGLQSNIDGNNYYYAGGGGGGSSIAGSPSGSAGTGGGSARNSGGNGTRGDNTPNGNGGAGGANTGGGGGGSSRGDNTAGNGGSGIVIVRYAL